MEDNGSVVVTLGKIANLGTEDEKLEKTVARCREKTIQKILEYVMDPKEDSLNPAYTPNQRLCRDEIDRWKQQAEAQQGTMDLMYIKPDGSSYSTPLSLASVVNDYPDMISEKTRRSEFGESVKYNGIDLIARFEPVNGR